MPTCTGVGRIIVVPSPTSPASLRPPHQSVSSLWMPHVVWTPVTIRFQVAVPLPTAVGMLAFAVEPLPSTWPAPSPQQYAAPSPRIAHVCDSETETSSHVPVTTCVGPTTRNGCTPGSALKSL